MVKTMEMRSIIPPEEHTLPFLSFLAQLENKKIKKDLMWILFYKGAILKILVLDSLAEELCFAYITIK